MTRRTPLTILLAATLLTITTAAACGDDSSSQQAGRAELTVRVTADTNTGGCTQATRLAGVHVGNDSRLTVTDGTGNTIGTGTFNLSPGLEPGVDICDWTATATVPTDVGFYTFGASGQLTSQSRAELEADDWDVNLHINARGDITIDS